eukprot:11154106-Ditylum_brightwellii.AAC.1
MLPKTTNQKETVNRSKGDQTRGNKPQEQEEAHQGDNPNKDQNYLWGGGRFQMHHSPQCIYHYGWHVSMVLL